MTEERWFETSSLGRYRYRLTRAVFFNIPAHPGGRLEIRSWNPARQHLATLSVDGVLAILPGYAWDGATSAPDIRKLQRAVVLHDLCCQCCEAEHWHLSRLTCDRLFLREARKEAPILAPLYYAGIRIGGNFHRWANPPELEQTVRIQVV
jgi:hypothetical protein